MEKSWYIVNSDTKIGPLDSKEIARAIELGRLSSSDQVWKYGLAKPMKSLEFYTQYLGQIVENNSKKESHATSEPLARKKILKLPKAFASEGASESVKGSSTSVIVPELPPKKKREPEVTPKVQIEKLSALSPEPQVRENQGKDLKERKASKLILRFSLALSVVLILAVGGVLGRDYFVAKVKNPPRPSQLSVFDYNRLLETRKKEIDPPQFSLATNQNMREIWGMTNLPIEGRVEIKIESLFERTLSQEPIILRSEGRIKNFQVQFDHLEFEEGSQIAPGYYEVDIKFSEETPQTWVLHKLNPSAKNYKTRKIYYLGNLSLDAFKSKLASFLKRKKSGENKYWSDLKQKYETVEVIIKQINLEYEKLFQNNSEEWKKNLSGFESIYTRNYGSFFSDLVIRNRKSYEELRNFNSSEKNELIDAYEVLSKASKSIGLKVVKHLQELENYPKLTEPLKQQKQLDLLSDWTKVETLLEDQKEKIEQKIVF